MTESSKRTEPPIAVSSTYTTLVRKIGEYGRMKNKWMWLYYSARMTILVLGASIPVMTTLSAWPWVIAVTGGSITAVEGMSQVWHLHDRYVAAREANRSLDKERLLYDAGAEPYDNDDRDKRLALRMHAFIDAYDDQVASALKDLGTEGPDLSPA